MEKKENKKEMFKSERVSFASQFVEAWAYIRESSNYIYFSIVVFVLFLLMGFILFERFQPLLDPIIKSLVEKSSGLGFAQTLFFILQNNISSSFLALIGGLFLAILPFTSALSNGLIVGYVLRLSWNSAGISEFWRLLPHGIFELPAIFISLGLGLKLGVSIFSAGSFRELGRRFYRSLNSFLMIVVPLLIIAAIIESLLIVLTNKF